MDRERRQERDRRADRDQPADRERAEQDRRGLDQVRDQAKVKQVAGQWRKMEQEHPEWSHAFGRHVDITERQLDKRAVTGELPNGKREDAPDHATKWRSADAMVVAADGLARSDEYRRRLARAEARGETTFALTKPLPEVLGPGWRAGVYGRTATPHGTAASQWNDDSVAKCIWRKQSDGRWHRLTCSPQPGP